MADAPSGKTGPSGRTGAPPPPSSPSSAQPTAGAEWPGDNAAGGTDWEAVVAGQPAPRAQGSVGRRPPASPAPPDVSRRGDSGASSRRKGAPSGSGGGRAGQQPTSRRARRRLRRQQKPSLWRGRILPKTVLGMAFTMLVSGAAMAASGVVLFMNYRYRQDRTDGLVRNFDSRTRQATRAVQAEGVNARALVQQELEPLRKLAATAETLTSVLAKAQPSVYLVRTFDVNGAPSVGTAFVVASDDQKSFLLTSYGVVQAATRRPGPGVVVHKGSDDLDAKLWTWQEDRDLALLIVDKGNLPRLEWAPADSARLGDQVFALSGLGAQDASITQGFVADVSSTGLQHSAPVGTAFQGGPLLNAQSQVVAVASRTYAPLGFVSDGVYFAPPVRAACEKVLKCPNGLVTGAGDQR